jgi:hypothetical protein
MPSHAIKREIATEIKSKRSEKRSCEFGTCWCKKIPAENKTAHRRSRNLLITAEYLWWTGPKISTSIRDAANAASNPSI